MNLSAKMVLLLAVVLSCCNLCFTKPLRLKIPFLRSLAFSQKSSSQEAQLNTDAFQSEQSISQESNIPSALDDFPDRPTAHNRTRRDTGHPCVSLIVRVTDWCRNAVVNHVECLSSHVSCHQAILTHLYPKCETVYGFLKAKFIGKCPALPIGCRCAT